MYKYNNLEGENVHLKYAKYLETLLLKFCFADL